VSACRCCCRVPPAPPNGAGTAVSPSVCAADTAKRLDYSLMHLLAATCSFKRRDVRAHRFSPQLWRTSTSQANKPTGHTGIPAPHRPPPLVCELMRTQYTSCGSRSLLYTVDSPGPPSLPRQFGSRQAGLQPQRLPYWGTQQQCSNISRSIVTSYCPLCSTRRIRAALALAARCSALQRRR
jgi:hypothetical protein